MEQLGNVGRNCRQRRNTVKGAVLLCEVSGEGKEMITLNKWYPMVQPTHTARELAFNKAVEKVQEEYRYAMECLKQVRKTEDLELELYDKRARQNTIELGSFEDRRRFQIFV
jgi:hypothetical protein